jgi:transposase
MANGHSEEFKRDAVRITLSSGLTRRQVASDLGMGVSTLNKYIKVAQDTEDASLPERWSRKFGPVVKVDRMKKVTIQNEETQEPFA